MLKVASRRSAAAGRLGLRSFQAATTTSRTSPAVETSPEVDVAIVGGGHNGLVAAAYLANQGRKVTVFERRHIVGGAAVTEELIPGFKFSRASYLAGLLRPCVIEELDLQRHGLKFLSRSPSSFTPSKNAGEPSLILGDSAEADCKSIAQFSEKDAQAYPAYEEHMGKLVDVFTSTLDDPPVNPFESGIRRRLQSVKPAFRLAKSLIGLGTDAFSLGELLAAPATTLLDRWFESDILKTTLATDAIIGSMTSPSTPGSAYVLLHHVMGTIEGRRGIWAYAQGGMGAVSNAIAAAAVEAGATIETNAPVESIVHSGNRVEGIRLESGDVIRAKTVLSNATPYRTFIELLEDSSVLPPDFRQRITNHDYSCGSLKINCAVDELPNFLCAPNNENNTPSPHHRTTIHFESTIGEIESAFLEAKAGKPAQKPVIEMTVPSSLDTTLAPEGKHVVQLFVQYAPYFVDPSIGSWADEDFKNRFADNVFSVVDKYAPNFSKSVIGRDVLSPLDLERIFGLRQGNIFHGAMSPHQLMWMRPAPKYSSYLSPLQGLYLCGAGAHPGGGVMGAAGRNCAQRVLQDIE